MYSPDLIQRIYFEKQNGDERNFVKVFNDLRSEDFVFISGFNFNERWIKWTCFESARYEDIILEADDYVYFYFRDKGLEFEVIIRGYISYNEKNKLITERTYLFHYVWVIGSYFPGLESVEIRPIKINLQRIKGKSFGFGSVSKLNCLFLQMLLEYESLSQPIFEPLDYQKRDDVGKPWRKLVDRKR